MKLLKELDFIHNKKGHSGSEYNGRAADLPFSSPLYLDCHSDVWQGQRSFSFL